MVGFIGSVLKNDKVAKIMSTVPQMDMKPLLDGMKLENSYYMKDACYDNTLVNNERPDCIKGSPWV